MERWDFSASKNAGGDGEAGNEERKFTHELILQKGMEHTKANVAREGCGEWGVTSGEREKSAKNQGKNQKCRRADIFGGGYTPLFLRIRGK